MKTIYSPVSVKITFRDDRVETFDCSDNPVINSDFVWLYLVDGKNTRRVIDTSCIQEIEYCSQDKYVEV